MATSHNKRGEGSRTAVASPDDEPGAVLTGTNLKGDWANLFVLITLYTLQGLPLGLSSSIPIFLQTYKSLSFQDQVSYFITPGGCH